MLTPVFALALSLSPVAAAQQVVVNLDPALASGAGVDAAQAESQLASTADSTLKVGEQEDFLGQMARATALSTRGMGVDYASNPEKFVFGIGFGSAVNGAGAQFGRGGLAVPEGGFAGSVSVMGGLNLGMGAEDDKAFGKRFRLYAHGMYWTPGYEPFQGTIVNYGGHLQVQVVRPLLGDVVEWGGLALTSGYQSTRFSLDLSSPIPVESGDLTWNADGTYTISAVSESVPVELSTNLRVLVATAYVGGGVDVNVQSAADSELVLDGDVEAGGGTAIGTATVTQQQTAQGDLVVPRVFVGLQADLLMVKLFGQLNIGFEDSFGGHVGLRVAI